MATKPKSRKHDDDLDTQDDDLGSDEELETDEEQSDDEDEEVEEEEGDDKGKDKGKKKETNEERLARELADAKKAQRALQRKLNEATGKLTKAGIEADDDPTDLKAQLTSAQKALAQYQAQSRSTQAREAIREVLADDERYAPFAKSVKYILTELELSDDDIDPDTGSYYTDTLEEAATKAVERFVKNAPRPQQAKGVGSGNAGGEASRSRANSGGKKSAQELLSDTDSALGGVFSKYGLIPSR